MLKAIRVFILFTVSSWIMKLDKVDFNATVKRWLIGFLTFIATKLK